MLVPVSICPILIGPYAIAETVSVVPVIPPVNVVSTMVVPAVMPVPKIIVPGNIVP